MNLEKLEITKLIAVTSTRWGSSVFKHEHKLSDFKDEQYLYIENYPCNNFIINLGLQTVTDNRGFSVKLSKKNVVFLIMNATIVNGRIAEPCQYARLRKHIYFLIPSRLIQNG